MVSIYYTDKLILWKVDLKMQTTEYTLFGSRLIVRVVNGEVFDVAVDLRKGSPTFGQWYGVKLSAENKKQFFIPKNFAHGFIVLSDYAEFAYKCTDFYHPNDEGGLLWSDPEIGVEWPMPEGMTKDDLILSDKDTKWSGISEYRKQRGL